MAALSCTQCRLSAAALAWACQLALPCFVPCLLLAVADAPAAVTARHTAALPLPLLPAAANANANARLNCCLRPCNLLSPSLQCA